MGRKIQHKRGLERDLPSLDIAELGFTTDTKKPFIGSGNGNIELSKKSEVDAELVKKADGKYVDAQHQEVVSQLVDTAEQTNLSIGAFDWWTPPKQPSFNNTDANYIDDPSIFPMNQSDYPYDDIMSRAWDTFSNDSSLKGYVTKSVFGKDQSGQYDIFKYEFTPPNYEKTIILGAALHGWENVGTAVLSRLMHHVCYDSEKYPQMNYLRKKVKIIVLPFQNPWGYINGRMRGNSRTVDLNRNFDYAWKAYSVSDPLYDAKGTAPESEKETQYIAGVLRNNPKSVAYIDFHNMTASSTDYLLYRPVSSGNDREIDEIMSSKLDVRMAGASNPSGYTYATKLDMYGWNPEFVVGRIGKIPYDSIEMTEWVEFAGNLILLACQKEKPSYQLSKEPFNYFIDRYWTSSGLGLNLGNYAEVEIPRFTFPIPSDGILTVSIDLVYSNSAVDSQNFFIPLVGQNSGLYKASEIQGNWEMYQSTVKANAKQTIHLSASISVNKTTDKSNPQLCHVGLYAYNDIGKLSLFRYRANITFVPSYGDARHRTLRLSSDGTFYFDHKGFKYYDY